MNSEAQPKSLRDEMFFEMILRRFRTSTINSYLDAVAAFEAHMGKPSESMGEREVRTFMIHLVVERQLAPSTQGVYVSALKFLYGRVLRRPDVAQWIPIPRKENKLPAVLSGSEVQALLDALPALRKRTVALVLYGCGLRISEGLRLTVDDIDSKRMVVHIRHTKNGCDRQIPLTAPMLHRLRHYWRQQRPGHGLLFPGTKPGKSISKDAIQEAIRKAGVAAELRKHVTPHVLRHSYATHCLELGVDLRTLQYLLGHRNIRSTMRYLHLSHHHLKRTLNPLDLLGTPRGEVLG